MVTPALFARYRTAADYARAKPAELEKAIQSTGFFRNKTKSIRAATAAIEKKHGGKVPQTMAELHALPGVGRKTANVVLGNAFHKNEGIVVDTHVARLSRATRPNDAERSGKNRARPDEADPAETVDELEPLAHLARASPLLRAQARLPRTAKCFAFVRRARNSSARARRGLQPEARFMGGFSHASRRRPRSVSASARIPSEISVNPRRRAFPDPSGDCAPRRGCE